MMSSPVMAGVAIVIVRVNNGSEVSIRRKAGVRLVAPKFRAIRVCPGLSSRDFIVIGIGSTAGLGPALCNTAPVNGTGAVLLSSIVRRRNSHVALGKETVSCVAPPGIRKMG